MAQEKEKGPLTGEGVATQKGRLTGTSLHLNAALECATLGMCIFPVHTVSSAGICSCEKGAACEQAGKHPRIGQWQIKATADEATVRQWWTRWPDANIGLHVGKSGIVVIDIDPRNGGDVTFEGLEQQHGKVSAMAETITGGNGRHLFFEAPEGVNLPVGLGDGIDLQRGDKYVILPPSRHKSGRNYVWRAGCDLPSNAAMLTYLPAWVAQGVARSITATVGANAVDDDVDEFIESIMGDDWDEETMERVKAALPFISSDERETWVKITAAIKSASGGDAEAYEIADEWAGSSNKYSATEQQKLWDSLSDKPGRVSLGTVFHLAKEGGWIERPKQEVTSEASGAGVDTGGDVSNGERFANAYRGKLLYCTAVKKWLAWDGARWAWCANGEAIYLAKKIAGVMLAKAQRTFAKTQSDGAKRMWQQALAVFNSEKRIQAMVSMATSEPGMSIANPGLLDTDPMLLGVRNGVVNLRLGTLLTASPDMLISKQAAASFDRSAKCPQWLAFLDAVFQGDRGVIDFIQRALGYTLTASVDEEKVFFMYGQGANGKSVFANVLSALFGEYSVTVAPALLAKQQNSEGDRYKAKLPGARLALANEVGAADVWDDQKLKEIASRERIAARQLFAEAFDFMPTHSLWIRGNHKPGVMDSGDAMWRRIVLIPFTRQFAESERVPDLDRKILQTERDGILSWLVEGCLAWQRVGLRIPGSIANETAAYRRDTDLMGSWIEEVCVLGKDLRIPSLQAFNSYSEFLDARNARRATHMSFSRQLLSRPGIYESRSTRDRGFGGIGFRPEEDEI